MPQLQLGKIVPAFMHSLAGLGVLMKSRSARQETAAAVLAIMVFALVGANVGKMLVLVALFLLVLGFEAVNTAIELNVDRVSPEQSDYARDTKDLGSFAVLCALLIWFGYFLWGVGDALL